MDGNISILAELHLHRHKDMSETNLDQILQRWIFGLDTLKNLGRGVSPNIQP
jgi:hypothetical protein